MHLSPKLGAAVGALAAGALLAVAAHAANEPAASAKAAKPAKAAVRAPAESFKPFIETRATDLLKAMSERLAAARSMSFTARITYEHPSRLGPPLAFTTFSEVLMQRPDKLRVITLGDGPASEFYYDGRTMSAYAPAENLIAVAPAPPTIDATLKAAFDSAAIYFPFSDVLVADPWKMISEGLIHAFYIGQSKVVGGTVTEMVAFANDDVFVQLWIGVEDKLPRLVRAVYRRDPLRLRHEMELANWKIDPPAAADAFATAKAATAVPIGFAHPGAKPAMEPPPRGKAAKAGPAKSP
ncbi:DUF2092 domain-containing protein [Accumulibacter sp.]|uniref:DUF2092 domain-containing protein n=1 Tax=Accumulibacter sp. TaxID=2053492 RepID=UPI0025F8B3FD|nr:DUF2092 domain-containing protein [Accumulibacter sp.]MCM8595634.1 DUF2092 domain-containing protein [Accumulibacter sp.]MCM8626047.1 DUF2092 domain-containing protein [Accumulibacter sp.]MDS4049781.1 DUF2092 domain-containing protein [Accumulibacter sp.]